MKRTNSVGLLSTTAMLIGTGAILSPHEARADVCALGVAPGGTLGTGGAVDNAEPTNLACGSNTKAGNPGDTHATAIGTNAVSTQDATAVGFNSQATSVNAVAIGSGAFAGGGGGQSVAVGGIAQATNNTASAFGYNASASGASDIKITVNKELSAHASGASDVRYKGNGVIRDLKSSGSSSVSKG